MTQTTTNYEQQAADFLAATGTTLTVNFLKHGKHFDDDKEERDIYQCELKRGSRSYKFNFGNSLANSGKYKGHKHLCLNSFGKFLFTENEYQNMRKRPGGSYTIKYNEINLNKDFKEPTAYSILSCLTKYDCGSFDDFCNEFGYDTDSKKAEKTYNAVKDEYMNVCALFTDKEIEQLQDIN